MKKNLFTLIIMVLLLVNTALTALMAILILPETQKVNDLITKVATAIDLDTEIGIAADASNDVPLENLVSYDIEDEMTISTKIGEDGEAHYVVLTVSISMDSTSDDYATYGSGDLSAYESRIKDTINSVVGSYTLEEFNENQSEVKDAITEALQTMFGSRFIVSVSFSSVLTQ